MNVADAVVVSAGVVVEVVIGLKEDCGMTAVVVVVDASVVSWMRLFGVVFDTPHLFDCGGELVVLLLAVDVHFLKTAAKESGTTGDCVVLRTLVTTVHLPMVTDGKVVTDASSTVSSVLELVDCSVEVVVLLLKLEAHFLKMEEKGLSGVTLDCGACVLGFRVVVVAVVVGV